MSRANRSFLAVALLVGALPAPLLAVPHPPPPQVPLWDHGKRPFAPGGNCALGNFPIGPDEAQGHGWKKVLSAWLSNLTKPQVAIPVPTPEWQAPRVQWSLPLGGGGTACINAIGSGNPNVPPNYISQVEQLYLHECGNAWGGETLARTNLGNIHFLAANVANTSDCKVHMPLMQWDPELSSITNLQYDGNPYSVPPLSDNLRRRGAEWLMVNLIVADYLWWSNQQGTVAGRFPCDRHFCPQVNAPLAASGRVLPVTFTPPVSYDDYDGVGVANFLGDLSLHDFDEAGKVVSHFAETYLNVRSSLGPAEQSAIEEALLTFAERLHATGRWTVMANLPHRTVVALWLAADAQQDLVARSYAMSLYEDFRDYFYDPNNGYFQVQGTFHQVSGFDTHYNDDDLINLARLSYVERNNPSPLLASAANAAYDLWAHLVLPDLKHVGNSYLPSPISPTAFNSRTGGGMADSVDRGLASQRFLLAGASNLPWAWAGMAGTIDWNWYDFVGWHAPWAGLACDRYEKIDWSSFKDGFHNALPGQGIPPAWSGAPPPFPQPEVAGYISRYEGLPNFAFLYGDHSLFTAWDAASNDPQLVRMPYQMPTPYHHAINQAFYYAHTDAAPPANEMVAIVHAGFVGSDDMRGFGGGQLSALWSPTAGVLSLARRRGWNNGGPPIDDDMQQWREMPLHAVSMVSPNNRWTSSSRIVTPTVFDYEWFNDAPDPADAFNLFAQRSNPQNLIRPCEPPLVPPAPPGQPMVHTIPAATAQMIRVCGDIPASNFGQSALSSPIPYQRDFLLSDGVVSVETRLQPLMGDPLLEAYETVPLFYGNAAEHVPGDFTVTLHSNNVAVQWSPGQAAPPFMPVNRVEVTRHNGMMIIDFPHPPWVSVRDQKWQGTGGDSYNLMIDLLHGQPSLTSTMVQYQITIL